MLQLGVPELDAALGTYSQHANVHGFDDIFREIFEALDQLRFLLQRGVKLGIVDRYGQISADGDEQFDIFTSEEITVDGLAQTENSNRAVVDAARDEVMEIELLKRAARCLALLTSWTSGIVKEVSARQFPVG